MDAVVEGPHALSERGWRGRKLEAEAGGVAAGEDGRAGRRAGSMTGIALSEIDALAGDGVDVGRGHRAAGYPAAVDRQVVVPEVISDDQDDVRPAPRRWRLGWTLLPGDLHWRPHLGRPERRLAGGRLCVRMHFSEDKTTCRDGQDNCRRCRPPQPNFHPWNHVPNFPVLAGQVGPCPFAGPNASRP